jgi:hypothetical protein
VSVTGDAAVAVLAQVRRSRADDAAALVAKAAAERLAAARARIAAQADLSAHVRRGRETAEECRAALERGELAAGDLGRLDACRRRGLFDEEALATRVRGAAERERAAIERERAARSALLARATEAQVAEAVVARRAAERTRKAEGRAEEVAGEPWRPKR